MRGFFGGAKPRATFRKALETTFRRKILLAVGGGLAYLLLIFGMIFSYQIYQHFDEALHGEARAALIEGVDPAATRAAIVGGLEEVSKDSRLAAHQQRMGLDALSQIEAQPRWVEDRRVMSEACSALLLIPGSLSSKSIDEAAKVACGISENLSKKDLEAYKGDLAAKQAEAKAAEVRADAKPSTDAAALLEKKLAACSGISTPATRELCIANAVK